MATLPRAPLSYRLPLVLGAMAAAWAGWSPARAQTGPGGAADTDSIWTIQVENDAVSTLKGTSDQYYTSGLRVGWTSGADAVAPVTALGRSIWFDGTTRISLEVSQSIFTPHNTQINPPDPRDRPYAAELVATAGLIHDSSPVGGYGTRDVVAMSLGVVGPSAQGEQVQNGFHNIIGDTPNRGWNSQLQDQPAIQFLGQRIWRLPLVVLGPIETDALPSVTGAFGTVRDYVQGGAVLRFGQGLGSDFGTPRIVPGLNGSDAFTNTVPFAWYGFAGVDGQAVGYDVSLDGSTFRAQTLSVHRKWDVGEIVAGAAVLWHGLRFSYTQTWQTQEFVGARSGLFNFGSLAVSAKF